MSREGRGSMADGVVIIGDHTITIDDIAAIARHHTPAALSRGARERMVAARTVVERHIVEDVPVYGLTTGLGAGVDTRLAADDLSAFQRRVAFARAVGVGEAMPVEEVRAMMAA